MAEHWTSAVQQPVGGELYTRPDHPAKGPEMMVTGVRDDERVIR